MISQKFQKKVLEEIRNLGTNQLLIGLQQCQVLAHVIARRNFREKRVMLEKGTQPKSNRLCCVLKSRTLPLPHCTAKALLLMRRESKNRRMSYSYYCAFTDEKGVEEQKRMSYSYYCVGT
jgi:hypothetical protein